MKKTIYILLMATVSSQLCLGQEPANSTVSILDTSIDPAGYISELKPAPAATKGTAYLTKNWVQGKVVFRNGITLHNANFRYNLQGNNLELKTDNSIKIAPLYLITTFSYEVNSRKQVYVYAELTNLKPLRLSGVVQRLYKNKLALYAYPYTVVQEPTYTPEFDTGSRSPKIIKKTKYYLVVSSTISEVYSSFSKNKSLFEPHYKKLKAFIKTNKLNLKDSNDLIKLLRQYEAML